MAINFDLPRGSRLREFVKLRQPWFVGLLFAALMATQALGFLVLGTGRAGRGLAEPILVLVSFLALACAWNAFRRAQGITALFWFLFAAVLVVLLVPTAFQAYDTLFDQAILSDSTWRLLYCLYGAPILMMLFLPENHRRARVKSEIFLDFFQVAIVVGLVYSTFFFLPVQRMLPADALLHNISISDAQSLLLLIAALVRLQFARVASTRNLLLRLALFLLVCAIATFIGDWIDLHHYVSAAAWFDLGWAVPNVAAGLIALTWKPFPEPQSTPEPANFLSFLVTNLVLVGLLCCINLLMDRVALTCSAKVPRSAFLSSPTAIPSEPCPSRMMIPCRPFLAQTLTPASWLAASSSPLPPPNTSRSRLPTSTCVNLSACRPYATRSPASTTVATCRNSSIANSFWLAGSAVP